MDVRLFALEDPDVCLVRRLRRDLLERGRSVESVLQQYEQFVKPSYEACVPWHAAALSTHICTHALPPSSCASLCGARGVTDVRGHGHGSDVLATGCGGGCHPSCTDPPPPCQLRAPLHGVRGHHRAQGGHQQHRGQDPASRDQGTHGRRPRHQHSAVGTDRRRGWTVLAMAHHQPVGRPQRRARLLVPQPSDRVALPNSPSPWQERKCAWVGAPRWRATRGLEWACPGDCGGGARRGERGAELTRTYATSPPPGRVRGSGTEGGPLGTQRMRHCALRASRRHSAPAAHEHRVSIQLYVIQKRGPHRRPAEERSLGATESRSSAPAAGVAWWVSYGAGPAMNRRHHRRCRRRGRIV